ncbi:MAG: hypothetical protein AAF298_04875 [Cyanobacteria bacterium P01_A01_bin.40]
MRVYPQTHKDKCPSFWVQALSCFEGTGNREQGTANSTFLPVVSICCWAMLNLFQLIEPTCWNDYIIKDYEKRSLPSD